MMILNEIYKRLELADDCLVRLSDPNWKNKVSFPSRIYRLLETNDLLKDMDAFFCLDNKPLILFFKEPKDKQALHRAIWNFNESPIAVIIENNAVEIYNGFIFNKTKKLLEHLGGKEYLNDFEYFKLVTGKTWEKYQEQLSHKNRVDYKLLCNIKVAQELLKEQGLSQSLANKLIGKIIFYRYLIDRQVTLNYQGKEHWTNEDLCLCLSNKDDFFAFVLYLENRFNGDMFQIDQNDYQKISQSALNVLCRLLKSEDLISGQQSLFNIYDFSILPIEFISNVYEKFIGVDKQDEESAYYTPTFLVDYIVAETVGKKLSADETNYNCRILDPSCGSGIFLVESLRRIIEKYKKVENITETNTELFREGLRQLVLKNIYGIDKDYDAIQVAIFSIYLTLLDYQEPADIEKFQFPPLYGINLICSDTFDTNDKGLNNLKNIIFDYIIGNPPWKGAGGNELAKNYLKNRRQKENHLKNKIAVNNNELAEYFVFRVSDFCHKETEIALIIHSTSLYNSKDGVSDFRKYLLDTFLIKQITELSCVRKEVFDKPNDKDTDSSIAPACILFYKYAFGQNTDTNVITHISIKPSKFFSFFKVLVVCRNDIQQVQQNRLKKNDWLWKVLVYGSYLDFIFIKRLKEFTSFKSVINNRKKFVHATGVTFSKNSAIYDVTHWKDRDFINTRAVECFHIDPDKVEKFQMERLGRNRTSMQDIFIAPMLLIRHGLDLEKLIVRSAISYKTAIFKKSLLSVKAYDFKDVDILKNISCFYSSNLMSYLAILTFSSVGIERENAKEFELLNIPYLRLSQDYYNKLESMHHSFLKKKKEPLHKEHDIATIQSEISKECKKINEEILQLINIDTIERDLIDYALNISLPMIRMNSVNNIMRKYKALRDSYIFSKIELGDQVLEEYAQVYIDYFARSFNRNEKRFIVEVHYSSQIIGMFFKVIDQDLFSKEIITVDTNTNLITLVTKLSTQHITDQLFVQKDIRGFEKDFFYIFKPNEKRLWHKAIAHLDVNEFDDAILKAGRNEI